MAAMQAETGADASRWTLNVMWEKIHKAMQGVPPDPPTSILMVPLGPRLDRITSCRPFAALMFMKRAAPRPMTSALELSVFTDVMAGYIVGWQSQESNTKL